MTEYVGLQLRTLRAYGELMARDVSWAGKLVVTAGEGCASGGLPPAVAIAGGGCLAVDSDAKSARAAMREGGVDFVVNTLDEALRVLKNEVRQKRRLAVALVADSEAVRAEANERGVFADLGVNAGGFAARASMVWDGEPSSGYTAWLAKHGWREEQVATAPSFEGLRGVWVRGIVRYQRTAVREMRWVWA